MGGPADVRATHFSSSLKKSNRSKGHPTCLHSLGYFPDLKPIERDLLEPGVTWKLTNKAPLLKVLENQRILTRNAFHPTIKAWWTHATVKIDKEPLKSTCLSRPFWAVTFFFATRAFEAMAREALEDICSILKSRGSVVGFFCWISLELLKMVAFKWWFSIGGFLFFRFLNLRLHDFIWSRSVDQKNIDFWKEKVFGKGHSEMIRWIEDIEAAYSRMFQNLSL